MREIVHIAHAIKLDLADQTQGWFGSKQQRPDQKQPCARRKPSVAKEHDRPDNKAKSSHEIDNRMGQLEPCIKPAVRLGLVPTFIAKYFHGTLPLFTGQATRCPATDTATIDYLLKPPCSVGWSKLANP